MRAVVDPEKMDEYQGILSTTTQQDGQYVVPGGVWGRIEGNGNRPFGRSSVSTAVKAGNTRKNAGAGRRCGLPGSIFDAVVMANEVRDFIAERQSPVPHRSISGSQNGIGADIQGCLPASSRFK